MEQGYAKVKVTFPRQSVQHESPAVAFSRLLKVEVDGKPLLCRDIEIISVNGEPGELRLRVSPHCFEIAVESETANNWIDQAGKNV